MSIGLMGLVVSSIKKIHLSEAKPATKFPDCQNQPVIQALSIAPAEVKTQVGLL